MARQGRSDGGMHLYFKAPADFVVRNTSLRPGIDLRHCDGYLILPPSIHEKGNPYRWEIPIPEERKLLLPDSLPDAWLNALPRKDQPQAIPALHTEDNPKDDSAASQEETIESLPPATEEVIRRCSEYWCGQKN